MGRRMILPFLFFQLEVSQSGEFLESIQMGSVSFRQAISFQGGLLKEGLSLGQGRIVSGQVQGIQHSMGHVRIQRSDGGLARSVG